MHLNKCSCGFVSVALLKHPSQQEEKVSHNCVLSLMGTSHETHLTGISANFSQVLCQGPDKSFHDCLWSSVLELFPHSYCPVLSGVDVT